MELKLNKIKEYLDNLETLIEETSKEDLIDLFSKTNKGTKTYAFLENYINTFNDSSETTQKPKEVEEVKSLLNTDFSKCRTVKLGLYSDDSGVI